MENENIEQIKQKLEFMGINRVVSIDNEWVAKDTIDLNKNITDFVEEMHPQNEKELLRIISNNGYSTLKDAYADNNAELIELIDTKAKEKNKLPPNLKKLDDILKLLENNGLYVDRINKYKNEIFEKYNSENCLFILDKEMDDGDNKDIIKESIPSIIKQADENGVNHLIIVYSSNIGTEYLNNSEKLKYINDRIDAPYKNNFYIYKMFAIEKKSETKLAEELNMKISDCIYGDALYHYMVLEKKKADDIYNSICKIENDEIARISVDNIIEGNNIKDSINTIKKALTKIKENENIDKERSILEKFNFYQKNKIKDFVTQNDSLKTTCKYKKYREGQNAKFVENILKSDIATWENIDYSINKFYADISTGDIFKIKLLQDKDEKYLLIVQNACDCILRNQNNIQDISRRYKDGRINALLLEKCDISKIHMNEFLEQFNNGEIIFPVKEKEYYFLRNTEKIISVPQILFDLCTLNEEGKCSINYDKEIIQKYKSYYFEKYMDMPGTLKSINFLKTYLILENAKMDEILKLQEKSEDVINSFELDKDSDGNLCVSRIGRLDYNVTLRVCQKNYYKIEDKIVEDLEDKAPFESLKKQRKSVIASTEKIVAVKK